MKKLIKKRHGFTLIEMTVVLFIISLLILIIIPNVTDARNHAQNVHDNAMVSVVQSQVDAYLDDDSNGHKTTAVGYSELQDDGYLTKKQVDKAKSENIDISNNKAIINSGKSSN